MIRVQDDRGGPGKDLLDCDASFEAGDRGTDAEVQALAEGEMGGRSPVIGPVGKFGCRDGWVGGLIRPRPVGRGPHEQDTAVGRDGYPTEHGVARGGPVVELKWTVVAQDVFDRAWYERGITTEALL